jgi:hypothetical protein
MALPKIKDIGADAFADGFLNKDRAQEIIDRLNIPTEVKLSGSDDAKVLYGTENTVIDLTPMLGGKLKIWTVINGGLFECEFIGRVVT